MPWNRAASILMRSAAIVAASAIVMPAIVFAAPDVAAPTVTAPVTKVKLWGNVSDRTVPFKATWTGTDPSGIRAYRLQLRVDAGTWSTVSLVHPTARHARLRLEAGHAYQLRVRATDGAGNKSAYAPGPAFRFRRLSELANGVTTTGTWTRRANDGFLGGHALVSGSIGAEASFEFTGSEIAWIATTGPKRGSTSVYLDDTFKTMTNIHRPTTKHRRLAYRFAWPDSGEHVLRLVAVPGLDAPDWYMDIDGFVVVEPVAEGDPVS